MPVKNQRDKKGKFKPGNKLSPGRPKKEDRLKKILEKNIDDKPFSGETKKYESTESKTKVHHKVSQQKTTHHRKNYK